MDQTYICKKCNKTKKLRARDGHRNFCDSCCSTKVRRNFKKLLVEHKGGKCQICGYNRCQRSLAFHHVDPSQKDFCISSCKNKKDAIREIEKCVLLCHNCHNEIHAGLITLDLITHKVKETRPPYLDFSDILFCLMHDYDKDKRDLTIQTLKMMKE